MDRKGKSLGLLGAFGIVGEAFKIIQSQTKLLGYITLVFILPLALIDLVQNKMAALLLTKIISYNTTDEQELPLKQMTELLVLQTVYPLLCYVLLMPSMAAAVYTVANHKPSLAGVMKVVPAVWKRMIITCLWYSIIQFLILIAFVFAICFLALGFLLFGKSYGAVFPIALFIVCMVLLGIFLHVKMVWQVANAVSVMEEEYYGLEGMKRSRRLLEGKRSTGWGLMILYLTINGLLGYTASRVNVHVVGLWAKIVFGTACVVMGCVVALMGKLTQSVLYFACKAYHGEGIDGNLGEYQALNKDDGESLGPLNNI